MGARTKARKRALDLLFEADQRSLDALTLLRDRLPSAHPPIPEYAVTLIEGVVEHEERIAELLATYSQGWSPDRMPAVDRQILRIAVQELLFQDDVPAAVAISEAVELAKSLSTDQSAGFVNGLLGRIHAISA